MKICILTQPLESNYGGILQAFALQKVLRDLGHDVTTLRWLPSRRKTLVVTARRFLSKYLKGNRRYAYCNPNRQIRFTCKELSRFVDEHMQCLVKRAPLSANSLPDFDAFIVGSDQVWRPMYSPCLPNFYLDFLKNSPVRRIAYAASFGVDTWETDETTTAKVRPLAQKFNAISVREQSGVRLCADYLGVKACVMPDPTLLLKSEDYLELCKSEEREAQPYLAAYILDAGDREREFAERVAGSMGVPVKYFGKLDWTKQSESLESWLGNIANASYVITDSFHGTVFSIVFRKNFLSVVNTNRGASRFTSLLESLGLQSRLIDKSQLEDYIPDAHDIDYSAPETALREMRNKGLSFLRQI